MLVGRWSFVMCRASRIDALMPCHHGVRQVRCVQCGRYPTVGRAAPGAAGAVAAGGDGLADAQGAVLARVEHDGRGVLSGTAGGGLGAVLAARVIQYRSGHPDTGVSQVPAFGRDGILPPTRCSPSATRCWPCQAVLPTRVAPAHRFSRRIASPATERTEPEALGPVRPRWPAAAGFMVATGRRSSPRSMVAGRG